MREYKKFIIRCYKELVKRGVSKTFANYLLGYPMTPKNKYK